MNLCLAIDSSGRGGQVVLAAETAVGDVLFLARLEHDLARGNAETLFGLFDDALTVAGREKSEIQRVAVIQGPGSFTGLRIGIMTAKGLAYALSCELWSAASLPLLAAESPEPCLALVGAGRGHGFVEHFGGAAGGGSGPARLDAEGIASWAARLSCPQIRFSTSDAAAAELVASPLLSGCTPVQVVAVESLARRALLGQAPAQRSEPAALLPVYLAPSQAERTHGIDLDSAVHTARPPESWG
jgi:tRNA threonylcarbamoyl adenosine modification protein YeaZ